MTRSAQSVRAAFAFSLAVAACGGVDPDRFSQPGPGAAGNPPILSSATPAVEAGAAGAEPVGAGGSPAAGAASGGATPVADAGAAGAAPEPPPPCVAELCNGKDDDCDGATDEGCPVGLAPSNAVQRKPLGDSTGGSPFAETCANDELLVGLTLGVASWLEQGTAICQKYSLSTNKQQPTYRYSLGFGERRALAAHPATSTSPARELSCAPGSVMVGLRVSQQHTAYGQPGSFIVIPQVSIQCAEPRVDLTGGAARVVWQDAVLVGPVSGGFANGGAWFESDLLTNGELLLGLHGASGIWVDRLGLTAGSVRVMLAAE